VCCSSKERRNQIAPKKAVESIAEEIDDTSYSDEEVDEEKDELDNDEDDDEESSSSSGDHDDDMAPQDASDKDNINTKTRLQCFQRDIKKTSAEVEN
jgi:hypothetical protein